MDFKKIVSEQYGLDEDYLEIPPDPELGDVSYTKAFHLGKKKKKNPKKIAENIAKKMTPEGIVENIILVGPYINFFMNKKEVMKRIMNNVLEKKEDKEKDSTILLEFPSPNTNKPLHIGHLLQMSLGLSLSRIFEKKRYDVKRINLYNDRGIHICKSMLAYKKWGKKKEPDKKPDHFVGDFYLMFERRAKKNPELIDEVKKMLKKWEEGDKNVRELWKKMNNWCYKGFKKTYDLVGLDSYDKIYYESSFYKKGKKIVKNGVDKGLFEKEEDGAVFVNLGELGKKYLIRGGGTTLYVTQDLALANLKYEDFPDFDKSIYMTGNEQNHYFKQLFKIFDILSYPFAGKCYHIGTGMVRLPEGKMSSREGNVIYADDLIEKMIKLAEEEIKKRGNTSSDEISEKIALAAIKYHLLKTSASKDIVLNPEETISFEGDTGPYLLYSLVRAYKILKKSKTKKSDSVNTELFKTKEEYDLIRHFSDLNKAISKSSQKFSPHILCKYVYDLASYFNSFYEVCPVINADSNELKNSRLLIVESFSIIMEQALFLLGIDSVKKM